MKGDHDTMRFPASLLVSFTLQHTIAVFNHCSIDVARVVAVSTLGRVYECHVFLSGLKQRCPCAKRHGRCSKVVVHQHVCWLAAFDRIAPSRMCW
jgi:hypothetical protein